jgi:sensor histidine kinase regulating citrate/malate metabolism
VLIRRVLGNMVKNALEAVREGDRVSLNCVESRGGPLFSVSNPGVMDKKVKNQIFMRHFSTKGADRGLGTYSIKLLGENYLQGKVWFESGAESGTTFYLWLPGAEAPDN